MAVAVGGDDPSTWPKAKMLFEGPYLLDVGPTHFDVARDGRLLMVKPSTEMARVLPSSSSWCRTGSRSCAGLRRGSESDREQSEKW